MKRKKGPYKIQGLTPADLLQTHKHTVDRGLSNFHFWNSSGHLGVLERKSQVCKVRNGSRWEIFIDGKQATV